MKGQHDTQIKKLVSGFDFNFDLNFYVRFMTTEV